MSRVLLRRPTVIDYSIVLDSVGSKHGTLIDYHESPPTRKTDIPAVLTGYSLEILNVVPFDRVTIDPLPLGTVHTLAAWLKFFGSNSFMLFGQSNGFGAIYGEGNNNFVYRTSTLAGASVAYTPPINQWIHLAVTRNGTSIKFYVNGSQHGTTQIMTGSSSWDVFYLVGPSFGIGGIGSNGLIDDQRVYFSELAGARIAELAAGSEATGVTPSHHWKFDEGV